MAERRSGYRDGAAGESGGYWRPPRSQTHGGGNVSAPLWENKFCTDACSIPWGGGNVSVPLWEKKFCTDACSIPWGLLCETKKLMSLYSNIVEWDDSAAFETFKDAKDRFCAAYHGQPCYIPLPDPDMYIDVVNPDEHIDPELVADLERSRRRAPRRDSTAPDGWDSFIFADKPVPATGWGDGETTNTIGQQCSVNWDNHVEQQLIEANCKQSSVNWDSYASQPAETYMQQSSGNWDMYVEQQGQTSSWGVPIMPCTSNWNTNGDPWNHDYGWGSAAIQADSWGNHKDNNYCVSDSQAQGSSDGHWRRRNNESGRRNSRNRDRGGPISSKAMKSKYQADEHSGGNNGWRHCRVRDGMQYSYEQPGYANQSLAM